MITNNPTIAGRSRPGEAAGEANHLYAYTVHHFDGDDGKKAKRWTRIGVAFPHKDGTGMNIELNAIPLNGLIVLFPPNSEDREQEPEPEPEPEPPPAAASRAKSRNR